MRRMNDDDGAVAVLVALLAVALFGFGALVIDVGALYNERRELQNGADAAALAIAQSCAATSCGDLNAQRTSAQPYANDNARDKASNLREICGSDPIKNELKPCEGPTSAAGSGFVKVRTQTGDAGSRSEMPPLLARVLDPDYDPITVGASAVANWGAPGGVKSALPFTFGDCEWEYYTKSGSTYPDPIVPPSWPGPEAVVYLSAGPIPCPGAPPGSDTGGGFGWLGGDGDTCTETTVVDNFIGSYTGAGSHGCKWGPLVGTTVHVPVFDCHTDTDVVDPDLTPGPPKTCHGQGAPPDKGTSVRYHVVGYAAFYITGMRVPGNHHNSIVTKAPPCTGDQKCISGYFSKGLLPSGGPVTSGPNYGTSVIGLAQ